MFGKVCSTPFALLLLCSAAYADPISITGSFTSFTPSADTLTLNANSTNFSLSSPFTLQTGTYSVGHSGNLVATLPFTFSENVTIDGQTLLVLFSGSDSVGIAADDVTIFSGPATYFSVANVTLTPLGFTSHTLGLTQTAVTLQAYAVGPQTSATPEPTSIALLGTGLLSVVGMVRRRLFMR